MKLVVAPEPALWLAPLLQQLGRSVCVVAPWAIDPRVPLCGVLRQRLARRRPPAVDRLPFAPGWIVLEHLARRIRGPISAKLELRRLLDRLVALRLQRMGSRFSAVYAPSLAALRTFAAARPRGIETVLIDDLAGLRTLHTDLDAAARALPQSAFLRNYRAPARLVVCQEQEWVLASHALTGSHRSRRRLARAGLAASKIEPIPMPPATPMFTHDPSARAVLLAGNAASRYGLEVALEALSPLGDVELFVRPGEGAHPPSLRNPIVRQVGPGDEVAIAAVVAPSWVECAPPEVAAAARESVPIVATPQALGWLVPGRRVVEVRVGDAVGLRAAVARLLARSPECPLRGA